MFAEYIPQSRMMELFNIFSSSSGESRIELFSFALAEVFSNLKTVILGSYGSYTTIGGVGSYPHNLFSAWINLGIFGFISYLLLILILWIYAVFWYQKISSLTLYKTYIVFLAYLTVALIFSKSYNYLLVGFTVGICSQIFYRLKHENVSKQ